MFAEINNCTECSKHMVLADPDPHDWFCYDDKKVVCSVNNQVVAVGCRPYNIGKESLIPDWCPKGGKQEERIFNCKNKNKQRLDVIRGEDA